MQARAQWIDQLKGFGIVAVVLGHNQTLMQLSGGREFIYSWHMPLFFALSGMTLGNVDLKGLLTRLASLLWVYFAVSIALLPIGLLVFKGAAIQYDGSLLDRFSHALYGIVYGSAHTIRIGPLWFLPCLILSMGGAWLLIQACKIGTSSKYRTTYMLLLSLLALQLGGLLLDGGAESKLSWRLDWGTITESGYFFTANVVPLAIGFVLFGTYISTSLRTKSDLTLIISAAVAALIWASLFLLDLMSNIELAYGTLNNPFWAPIGSASAIYAISVLFYLANFRAQWLISIGVATLPILVAQGLIGNLLMLGTSHFPPLLLAVVGATFGVLLPWAADRFVLSKHAVGQLFFYPRSFFRHKAV